MTKILFVCLGNICRSPMAEFMFKDLINKNNLQDKFIVDSAATSYEEEGNSLYPYARDILNKYNIPIGSHKAHRMQKSDYDKYDLIIGMEESNIQNILRIITNDPENKVHRLLDFTNNPRDIADPWYTGNFEVAYRDIKEGLEALLNHLRKES